MAQTTIPNGPLHGDVRTPINTNFTELYGEKFDNAKVIKTASDLPASVGNVITLATDNMTYLIEGDASNDLDLGADRILITADGVQLKALNPYRTSITSTNVGALITCDQTLTMDGLKLVSPGSQGVLGNDASADTFIIKECIFEGQTKGVQASNFFNLFIKDCGFVNNTDGVSLSGNLTNAGVQGCSFNGVTGKLIDLDGCLSKAWSISDNVGTLLVTSTFLTIQVNSGNILTDGIGEVVGNKFDNSASGTLITGYSPFDTGWIFNANAGIAASDRVIPAGWGFYEDDISSTLSVTTSDTEVTINAVSANSNSVYLPASYIEEGLELWDDASNRISPAIVGDSFIARLQVTIDSVTGSPKSLNCKLDIGANVTPTIVISEDSTTLRSSSYPQAYTFIFPIFSLTTFVANGGKFYLQTDSGTATIGFRSIFIERVSTGAR